MRASCNCSSLHLLKPCFRTRLRCHAYVRGICTPCQRLSPGSKAGNSHNALFRHIAAANLASNMFVQLDLQRLDIMNLTQHQKHMSDK